MRSMVELRARRLLMLMVAITLAACSGADVAAPDAAPAAAVSEGGDSTGPTDDRDAAPQVEDEAVAEIIDVINVESFLNGEPALTGDMISPQAELSTNATGLVRFVFSAANAECVLIKSSTVVVISGGRRLLQQVRGETACEVDSPDGIVEFINNGRVVRMRRGLLRLTASAGGGGAQVLGGRAQAVNPDSGNAVDMGSGDSTGWDTSGELDSDAEPSEPTDDVDEAVAALKEGQETDSGVDANTGSSAGSDGGTDDSDRDSESGKTSDSDEGGESGGTDESDTTDESDHGGEAGGTTGADGGEDADAGTDTNKGPESQEP